VEDLVVVTQWHKGFAQCECPIGHADARVYVDRGVPFLHCLHEKCRDEVNEVNIAFREATAWMEDTPRQIKLTPAERAVAERKRQLRRLEVRTREYLLPRLRQHPVPLEEWIASSPYSVRDHAIEEHWQLFLQGLYELSELIWIGRLHESGAEHKNSFRRVVSWLDRFGSLGAPDPFVSVAGFDSTKLRRDWSRSRRNVSKRLYLILESDTESQEAFGAVVKYACKYMRLRALTDTGGKSLHAVFESFSVRHVVFPPRPEPEFYVKVNAV
jgi:hypothetical protein